MLELSKFSELVEEVLDFDSIESMEFLIKPDFDDGLADIRDRMKSLKANMSKQLNKVLRIFSCTLSSSVFSFYKRIICGGAHWTQTPREGHQKLFELWSN